MIAAEKLARLERVGAHLRGLVSELRTMHEEHGGREFIATEGEALFCEYEFDKLCDRVDALLRTAKRVHQPDLFERTLACEPMKAGVA
jgi:hypothetical protein